MLKIWKPIMEGTFWSTALGMTLFAIPLPAWWLFDTEPFARRWDGGCSGWTQDLAILHMTGDLLQWWAYVTISFVVARLHPIMWEVPSAPVAVLFMILFIFGCGLTHLFNAYSVLYPVYRATGTFLVINGVVSVLAAIAVAHALVSAFAMVAKKDARLEELECRMRVPYSPSSRAGKPTGEAGNV